MAGNQVSVKNNTVNANIAIAGFQVDQQAKAKKKLAHLLQSLEHYLGKLSYDSTIDICFAAINKNVFSIGFPILCHEEQKYYVRITFGDTEDCWSIDSDDVEPKILQIINQKLQAMHQEIYYT